eukprot:SAG31_NODE_1010_length_10388_cov_3.740014_7_plen_69_part_00
MGLGGQMGGTQQGDLLFAHLKDCILGENMSVDTSSSGIKTQMSQLFHGDLYMDTNDGNTLKVKIISGG